MKVWQRFNQLLHLVTLVLNADRIFKYNLCITSFCVYEIRRTTLQSDIY